MSKILIFDTECDSLNVNSGHIQELAWAIYNVNTWRLLSSESYLIKWNTFYKVEPEAFQATGLSREFCEDFGTKANIVFTKFLESVSQVDYVGGHNIINYDVPMLNTNVKRACLFDLSDSDFKKKLLIDSYLDCPFPPNIKMLSLKYLAFDHGHILSDAHQALADVFACKAVMSKYRATDLIKSAETPLVKLSTKIDWNDNESKAKIKNLRFYWNPQLKQWEKDVREYYAQFIKMQLEDSISFNMEIK